MGDVTQFKSENIFLNFYFFQKLIDFVEGAGWIAREIVEVAISTAGEMPFVTVSSF